MSRRIVGPFNRVEGDLEVELEIEQERVKSARVSSSLFRGFEQMLQGKEPGDALVYTPRICGICSVSQSVAAARALAALQGVTPPLNGELAINLILANENVADHLTHFYLFFMPDFARETYRGEPWYPMIESRFRAQSGSAAREMLPARAQFMHLMGLMAGKWPHSLAIQPGGTTRAVEMQERARLRAILFGFRRFLETTLYGDTLENIASLNSIAALDQWIDAHDPGSSDFRRFLEVARALDLHLLGRGNDRFMSYGVYRQQGEPGFRQGLWDDAEQPLETALITEDLSHSWMVHQKSPRHPFDGITLPDADVANAYSWCKAPRLDGRVVEVGALARQQVDGQSLVRALVAESGGNVRNRVIARLLEIARVVMLMETWVMELKPGEAFCNHKPFPQVAQGYGLVEAARGSLGHWIKVKNGHILNYQIIAPTTWNFSPRDHQGQPGALELALVDAPLRPGEKDPVSVQHIVRSFDPCMVCTVH
ncbi:MAG: nickel-dependent hydrogenase large subunit [Candidatus Thiodiazotropha sp. (ex Lucina aurantia)]|uniref:Periplasmic [NiFeSe] hydrogenase large subunit n=2 Tax=Candidatus Thiodiazotropha TaxID=1913444 RepID=A0A7Z0VPW2_9GAMM|nr:nickel-dependent hydrogenase large subunit [Candidatus Thiodiazotropha endolucinida]MBT3013772.1 nickel-dependent hydrogenase large subunit [Candidatus Thiodiazotropha sp. (ex Lucina pensylvanica)]MBT3025318.1 nickel-dependent hydrogenase large subunit [Candidatus Thiodiazotropha taylori]MBT3044701.1 nickel-dependent hydrogenase large subunit [Candidatus Thiodiazotropha sp. (ex Codakia orbicularis)]MBV2105220.1 nickel-dependent hydrogenase large subunit [Candidatus Thiodiazotropha sp. (ex Lu